MSLNHIRKNKRFDLVAFAQGFNLGNDVVDAHKNPNLPSQEISQLVVMGSPSFVRGYYAGVKKREQDLKVPEVKLAARKMMEELQKRMPGIEDPEFERKWKKLDLDIDL